MTAKFDQAAIKKITDKAHASMESKYKQGLEGKTCVHGEPLATHDCLDARTKRTQTLQDAVRRTKI